MIGLSFPAFVSGILLLVFAVNLRWFPVISAGGVGIGAHLQNLALPATTLGLIMTAYITRVTRSSLLNVLNDDYIRTAQAKGVRPSRLVTRHALRNALIPVVTVVGLYFGTMIGNSVLTEIVFTRPGLGKLILSALMSRDYTLLQGLCLLSSGAERTTTIQAQTASSARSLTPEKLPVSSILVQHRATPRSQVLPHIISGMSGGLA